MYLLLTAAAVAIAAAKVVGAENVYEPSRYKPPTQDGYSSNRPTRREWPPTRPDPTPMFSSNDKSRWATVRRSSTSKTYVIGKRTYPDPQRPEDVQRRRDRRGAGVHESLDIGDCNPEHARSSIRASRRSCATCSAGEYWLLKRAFGWDIVRDRWLVIPAIVFTVNVLPFAVYLVLLARLIDGIGKTDFGKLLAFTAGGFGTFLHRPFRAR